MLNVVQADLEGSLELWSHENIGALIREAVVLGGVVRLLELTGKSQSPLAGSSNPSDKYQALIQQIADWAKADRVQAWNTLDRLGVAVCRSNNRPNGRLSYHYTVTGFEELRELPPFDGPAEIDKAIARYAEAIAASA